MAKKDMKRPGYTGPEAKAKTPGSAPQDAVKGGKSKTDPGQTY